MFDNKKICLKALQRAEEIRMAKKRKQRIFICAALAVTGICAVVLVMVASFYLTGPGVSLDGIVVTLADERGVPLAGEAFGVSEDETGTEIVIYFSDLEFIYPRWFTFELSLLGSAEKLYISDFIESESTMRLDGITVSRTLESGSYAAVMHVRAYEILDVNSYFWENSIEFTLNVP